MHFNESQNLTPMTPNNPRLTCDPICEIKGLKLMHMYEIHEYTTIEEEMMHFSEN